MAPPASTASIKGCNVRAAPVSRNTFQRAEICRQGPGARRQAARRPDTTSRSNAPSPRLPPAGSHQSHPVKGQAHPRGSHAWCASVSIVAINRAQSPFAPRRKYSHGYGTMAPVLFLSKATARVTRPAQVRPPVNARPTRGRRHHVQGAKESRGRRRRTAAAWMWVLRQGSCHGGRDSVRWGESVASPSVFGDATKMG